MMKLASKQRGITFIGLVFVFGIIVWVVLFGLRLFPLYNEKMQVVSAMKSVSSRPDAAKLSTKDIQKYFLRNVQINGVERFNSGNIKDFLKVNKAKKGRAKTIHVQFEATNKLYQDIELLMRFDQEMEIRGANGGE